MPGVLADIIDSILICLKLEHRQYLAEICQLLLVRTLVTDHMCACAVKLFKMFTRIVTSFIKTVIQISSFHHQTFFSAHTLKLLFPFHWVCYTCTETLFLSASLVSYFVACCKLMEFTFLITP